MRNPSPYEPWQALQRMQTDLDRLLGFKREESNGDLSNVVTSRWTPAVDIKEEDTKFVITADIPGVDPTDIDVTMENGILTIKGERKFEDQKESEGYRRVERMHGTFYRRFSLPDHADASKISAKSSHGVLEVTVPKVEKVQPRRIEVK